MYRAVRAPGQGDPAVASTLRRQAARSRLWLQALSRVLAHAVESGTLAVNPCEGIGTLCTDDRGAIVWTGADIESFKSNRSCTPELALAVDLPAFTGLRLGDLIRLSWPHVGGDAFVIATGKSREKREAVIPIYDELREALDRIPKQSTVLLTSGREQAADAEQPVVRRAARR